MVREIICKNAKIICFYGILTKTFLLYNWNKLHENRSAKDMSGVYNHVRRLRYNVAHSYMGIANSSLACVPFFSATTSCNTMECCSGCNGNDEVNRWINLTSKRTFNRDDSVFILSSSK